MKTLKEHFKEDFKIGVKVIVKQTLNKDDSFYDSLIGKKGVINDIFKSTLPFPYAVKFPKDRYVYVFTRGELELLK